MSIASNTGPLIALAKADALWVLKTLFHELWIPPAVHREILAKTGPESSRLDEGLREFIRVVPYAPTSKPVEQIIGHLGAGEQQAIALASHLGVRLIMDDRQGRSAARRLGLHVLGTAGILLLAKQKGIVPQVTPVLLEIRNAGYYFSDSLVELIAKLAGETYAKDQGT